MTKFLLVAAVLVGLVCCAIGAGSSASAVIVRLVSFQYNPTSDTCDILGGACDARFTLDYRWNDNIGKQEVAEVDNQNEVSFNEAPKRLNGPFPTDSTIAIHVTAVDVDTASNDDIGVFFFKYNIPNVPGKTVQTERSGHGKFDTSFTIEFEPVFE